MWVGIDPDQKGALCYISEGSIVAIIEAEESPFKFIDSLRSHIKEIKFCCIEKTPLVPYGMKDGKPQFSVGSLSTQLGYFYELVGACKALNIPFATPLPSHWQKAILPGRPTKEAGGTPAIKRKNRMALKKYCIDEMRKRFAIADKISDGVADALALALFAKQVN